MNQTAKRLRKAADYIGDGEVCSDTAIVTVREMLDVGHASTFSGDLGRVLEAIADELDALQARTAEANNLRQRLESAEDKAERRKKHIGYLNTALHDKNAVLKRRGETIARLTAECSELRKQVPTERERHILDIWPRFEDGEPVMVGDAVEPPTHGAVSVEAIEFSRGKVCVKDAEDGDWNTSMFAMHPLKRPETKVLDADGAEIKVGDTVWTLDGLEGVVTKVEGGAAYIAYESDYAQCEEADNLTHTRPDSWERLEEDAGKQPYAYCTERDLYKDGDEYTPTTPTNERFARDLVRRAKALAGVEVG